jgi:FkbM family methyltransferase
MQENLRNHSVAHSTKPVTRSDAGRNDWLPVIGVSLVVALATFAFTTSVMSDRIREALDGYEHEARQIDRQFAGVPKSSQFSEEYYIRDFFKDRRDGVFLDVGANHYRDLSNTYFLETALGWSGLAIEPQTTFAADYVTHRPRTRFVAMFASDTDDRTVTLYVPPADRAVASADADFAKIGGATQATSVPSTTLNRVLETAGIARLDFLSMDIELHEPQALAGFDIAKYRPALVCIEGHAPVRQLILDYFQRHGYVMVGKYLRADFNNLYFTPASQQ